MKIDIWLKCIQFTGIQEFHTSRYELATTPVVFPDAEYQRRSSETRFVQTVIATIVFNDRNCRGPDILWCSGVCHQRNLKPAVPCTHVLREQRTLVAYATEQGLDWSEIDHGWIE